MVLHCRLHVVIKELLLPFFNYRLELGLQKFLLQRKYQLLLLPLHPCATLRLRYLLNMILAEREAFVHDFLLHMTVSRRDVVELTRDQRS